MCVMGWWCGGGTRGSGRTGEWLESGLEAPIGQSIIFKSSPAVTFNSGTKAPFPCNTLPHPGSPPPCQLSPLLVQGLQGLGSHTECLDLQGAAPRQPCSPRHLDCPWHIHLSLHSGIQHILKGKVPRVCWICRREKTKGAGSRGIYRPTPTSRENLGLDDT